MNSECASNEGFLILTSYDQVTNIQPEIKRTAYTFCLCAALRARTMNHFRNSLFSIPLDNALMNYIRVFIISKGIVFYC